MAAARRDAAEYNSARFPGRGLAGRLVAPEFRRVMSEAALIDLMLLALGASAGALGGSEDEAAAACAVAVGACGPGWLTSSSSSSPLPLALSSSSASSSATCQLSAAVREGAANLARREVLRRVRLDGIPGAATVVGLAIVLRGFGGAEGRNQARSLVLGLARGLGQGLARLAGT